MGRPGPIARPAAASGGIAVNISDPTHRLLRRLHTLTGILPVGLFLIGHFTVNFIAVRGPAAFNHATSTLQRLPMVSALELLGIAFPLTVHIVLGVLLGNTRQAMAERSVYPRPWMRGAQRVTGGFLVVFLLFHVWSTRLSPRVLAGEPDLFGHMTRHLRDAGVLVLYVLAVLAATSHLAIGLFDLAYRWGARNTRGLGRIAVAVFVVLSLVGLNALLAFVSPAARWLGTP